MSPGSRFATRGSKSVQGLNIAVPRIQTCQLRQDGTQKGKNDCVQIQHVENTVLKNLARLIQLLMRLCCAFPADIDGVSTFVSRGPAV